MSHTTRKTLLRGLLSNDEKAWCAFQDFYTPLIYICGRDYGLAQDELADLRQEVMVELFKKDVITKFDPKRGHFRSLLRKIIHHKAYAICQKRLPAGEESTEENARSENPMEQRWDEEWRHFRQGVALKQLRESSDEQQYMAFDLYALQGKDPQLVANILQMSINQVYLAKSRLGARLHVILDTLKEEEDDV